MTSFDFSTGGPQSSLGAWWVQLTGTVWTYHVQLTDDPNGDHHTGTADNPVSARDRAKGFAAGLRHSAINDHARNVA